MEKRIQIGSRYKEAVLKMSGGYGRWAWNATCYLKSEEFALWNKICEYSYRCQDPNGVLHLKKQSLYNYFSFDGGKEYVERNSVRISQNSLEVSIVLNGLLSPVE